MVAEFGLSVLAIFRIWFIIIYKLDSVYIQNELLNSVKCIMDCEKKGFFNE